MRVTEPTSPEEPVSARVAVVRLGDLSGVSVTRLYTRDGSAWAGADYHGVSRGESRGWSGREVRGTGGAGER